MEEDEKASNVDLFWQKLLYRPPPCKNHHTSIVFGHLTFTALAFVVNVVAFIFILAFAFASYACTRLIQLYSLGRRATLETPSLQTYYGG